MTRKGPGRPKVKPAQKCSKLISLRLTPSEQRALYREARLNHLSVSALVRRMLGTVIKE